jgi:hypothetical protein
VRGRESARFVVGRLRTDIYIHFLESRQLRFVFFFLILMLPELAHQSAKARKPTLGLFLFVRQGSVLLGKRVFLR